MDTTRFNPNSNEQAVFHMPVAAYHSPVNAMHHYGSLFIILCLRYLRQNPERMINDAGGYGPRGVSLTELIHTVTQQNSTLAEQWLENRKIPSLEQCNEMIAGYREYIRQCNELTRNAENAGPDALPIESIVEYFGLSTLEMYIVVVCALIQMDERYANAWRYVTGAAENEVPSISNIFNLLEFMTSDRSELFRCLRPDSPLVRYALIDIMNNPAWGKDSPIAYSFIKVPRRVLSFLLGEADTYLPPACRMLSATEVDPAIAIDKNIEKTVQKSLQKPSVRLGLLGMPGNVRTATLVHSARRSDTSVMHLNLAELYDAIHQTDIIPTVCFSEILREMRLRRAILCVDTSDLSTEAQDWFMGYAPRIQTILMREPFLKICVLSARQTSFTRSMFGELAEIVFPQPSRDVQPKLWSLALRPYLSSEKTHEIAETMSVGYCLSAHEIQNTIELTLSRKPKEPADRVLTYDNLSETINRTHAHGLEGLATIRSTALLLKDLVLLPQTRSSLDEIICHAKYSEAVMHGWGFAKYNVSGAGLSVLLSGCPGTGKTLTALVLGNELGRPVYAVNLSRIIDKSETEKKLSRIFDEAEKSQAILLFDEADSVFAKPSNDTTHFQDTTFDYLIQRLETYSGITVLTTNQSHNLDDTLTSRIQYRIEYPLPDEAQRLELWSRLIPPKAPREDDLNLKEIAQHFAMSGGHIKNAIFRASIQAMSTGSVLTRQLLWNAAEHEKSQM